MFLVTAALRKINIQPAENDILIRYIRGHEMLSGQLKLALDLKMLLMVFVANAAPVVAQDIFGRRFSYPPDGRAMFFNAQPLPGTSKSVRAWLAGTLIELAAMFGDLCSSFIKRQGQTSVSSD